MEVAPNDFENEAGTIVVALRQATAAEAEAVGLLVWTVTLMGESWPIIKRFLLVIKRRQLLIQVLKNDFRELDVPACWRKLKWELATTEENYSSVSEGLPPKLQSEFDSVSSIRRMQLANKTLRQESADWRNRLQSLFQGMGEWCNVSPRNVRLAVSEEGVPTLNVHLYHGWVGWVN